jgi:hypothetical protein
LALGTAEAAKFPPSARRGEAVGPDEESLLLHMDAEKLLPAAGCTDGRLALRLPGV